jgi:CheY-like chemotaxis protein
MGISAENIKHIFDEFYQINNPQRDREGGLGLGLPIAKRTLALLDTELTCHSRVGRGSVFGFRLPLQDTSGELTQPLAPIQNLLQHESFARNKRFVVLENDKLVSQGMVTWLEGIGAEVRCFHSAEEALRKPGIEDADYYIVDYMLDGTLNGIQLLNQLAHKSGKHIIAAIVTGDTSNEFIRDAKEFAWPVLHKPIHTSELIDRLIAQER